MTDLMILDQFDRLLDRAPKISGGAADIERWRIELVQSGFLDLLRPESDGGAGLALGDLFGLAVSQGARLVPGPIIETMLARALLGDAAPADRLIGLVTSVAGETDMILTDTDGGLCLMPSGIRGQAGPSQGLEPFAMAILAARMAGAMQALVIMTVDYVQVRKQFGKPIGQFQAIQQQLAVMCEEVAAASAAAHSALALDRRLTLRAAATAKFQASAAVVPVTAIAHAVHGAIGMSAEHDLPHYTRQLRAWRVAFGAETAQASRIGTELMRSDTPLATFARNTLQPSN